MKTSDRTSVASVSQASASAETPAGCSTPTARYLFFGGKGGVGKTTSAAATALLLLDGAETDEQLLLFSTDPAHSLSDSLGLSVGDQLVEVAQNRRGARLFAREMDAAHALEEFKTRHHGVLREIADRGTLLDETDINELLSLSLPGMDEVMSLFELSEIERTERYARIVVDTAPSGHTSRLLRLPRVFERWTEALDRMADKHRFLVARFARGQRLRADEVELFLQELAERIGAVRQMLYQGQQAAFTLVTIPEAMAVEETARYFQLLADEGVPVTDLIVNRVEQGHDDCPFCRARAAGQEPHLKRIATEFGALRLHRAPLLGGEVRGQASLRRFARLVWTDEGQPSRSPRRRRSAGKQPLSSSPPATQASGFRLEPRRLLIFGGKGGVGKTTAASAAALALALENERRRVLLFSTDPAHSLSDSFAEEVGELKRALAGHPQLDAMEIDPAAYFEALKERYRDWTDKLFASLTEGSRWEVQFDREAMRSLVALAPPGIDEIAALSRISDLLEEGDYTEIVLDTAPTGHLIRFLELPEIALSWIRTFIKLLLKYKSVVKWDGIAEELVALSKSIKRVAALLVDAEACEFVGVAIPERMSLEETLRLAATLRGLRIPMRRLLINHVITEEAARACDFCDARRRAQAVVLREFAQRLPEVELFFAPEQPREIRGQRELSAHFARWQKLSSPAGGRKRPSSKAG